MKKCFLCLAIRYFIFAVLFIIIVSLTLSDNLHYLSFVNPKNFAYLIILLGLLLFIGKLFFYIKNKD